MNLSLDRCGEKKCKRKTVNRIKLSFPVEGFLVDTKCDSEIRLTIQNIEEI